MHEFMHTGAAPVTGVLHGNRRCRRATRVVGAADTLDVCADGDRELVAFYPRGNIL
jgi:hypothetical protein